MMRTNELNLTVDPISAYLESYRRHVLEPPAARACEDFHPRASAR